MPRKTLPSTPLPTRATRDGLRLTEAAALVGVSASTLRRHVKAGRLKASQTAGTYGQEYRVLPAVLRAFALEAFGVEVSEEALEVVKASKRPPNASALDTLDVDRMKLVDLLLAAKDEASEYRAQAERYKAICEQSEDTKRKIQEAAALEAEKRYQAQVAELLQEKTALQERLAELEKPGLFRRLFGGGK
jgi:excisionase family DNA binding protein